MSLKIVSLPPEVLETIFSFTCNNPLDRPLECPDAEITCRECKIADSCVTISADFVGVGDLYCKGCRKPRQNWKSNRIICCKRCASLACIYCTNAPTYPLLELRAFHSTFDLAMRDWVGHFNKWGRENVVFDEQTFIVSTFGFGIDENKFPILRTTAHNREGNTLETHSFIRKAMRLAFALCGARFSRVNISHRFVDHIRFLCFETFLQVNLLGQPMRGEPLNSARFFSHCKEVELILPWTRGEVLQEANSRRAEAFRRARFDPCTQGHHGVEQPVSEIAHFKIPAIPVADTRLFFCLLEVTSSISKKVFALDVILKPDDIQHQDRNRLHLLEDKCVISKLFFCPAENRAIIDRQNSFGQKPAGRLNPFPPTQNDLDVFDSLQALSATVSLVIYLDFVLAHSWEKYFESLLPSIRKMEKQCPMEVILRSEAHSIVADTSASLKAYLESEKIDAVILGGSAYLESGVEEIEEVKRAEEEAAAQAQSERLQKQNTKGQFGKR